MASYKYGSGNAGNRTSKITEAETITYLNDINGSLTQVLAEIGSDGNLKCCTQEERNLSVRNATV